MLKKALTIAGSDSGAGAGIQADLKTFSALNIYATSVITAVTAQNTQGITGIQEIEPKIVKLQLDAVLSDIGSDSIKIGIIPSIASIKTVSATLKNHGAKNIVVDPVLVSTSGFKFGGNDVTNALVGKLFCIADIITPNVSEAETLSGIRLYDLNALKEAAKMLHKSGTKNVLIKGWHHLENITDFLFDGRDFYSYETKRIKDKQIHGAGCTFSSAIAAFLAMGLDVKTAIGRAKEYTTQAIACSLSIGYGLSPTNHFFKYWNQ